MIVDCHTHWGLCWAERYDDDVASFLKIMDHHKVDKAVLMAHEGLLRQDRTAVDNDRIARIARAAPDRFIPVGSAWPQMGDEAIKEIKRCAETLGVKALKFHPWLQGFTTFSPVFGEICGLAGEIGLPVIFHDGTPCYSLAEQIAGMAREFPKTTFVLGHSGLLWNWRSAVEACRRPNVWLCLCGPHLRAIEILCERADPDRIVWGSDYGFGLMDLIDYRMDLIRTARIRDSLREKILGENPLRLIGDHV
jgi:predicted TIM-barrel fold metal-dependent hydrolase